MNARADALPDRTVGSLLALALLVSGCGGTAPVASTAASTDAGSAKKAASSDGVGRDPPALAPIQLEDVAESLGVNVVSHTGMTKNKYFPTVNGQGVAMVDFDLDGWPDLYFGQGSQFEEGSPKNANALFRSDRGRRFEECAAPAGAAIDGFTAGLAAGDYNSDGFPDLLLTRVGPQVLLCNNGDGTFSDRSKEAGVDVSTWGTSAAFFDYDNDGNLDFYLCGYGEWSLEWHKAHPCSDSPVETPQEKKILTYCGPPYINPAKHYLFRSRGDGRFEDRLKEAGLGRRGNPKEGGNGGRGQGVVACDLNNDGLVDLYVANDMNNNFVFLNKGRGKFADVSTASGAELDAGGKARAGMGVDAQDMDGDGWPDVLVTNFHGEDCGLFRNDSAQSAELSFLDVCRYNGLASGGLNYVKWGTSFEDLDNDGWLDVFIVNGHVDDNLAEFGRAIPYKNEPLLWRNVGKGRFVRLAEGLSPYFATKRSSRGAAFGDLFNDGQVHVVVTNRDDPAAVLRNTSRSRQSQPNAWLQFLLVGVVSNRDAVGARIELKVGDRRIVRHVRGGRSYLSAHDPRITVGLGGASEVDRVVIFWPSGKQTILERPQVNRSLVLTEPF